MKNYKIKLLNHSSSRGGVLVLVAVLLIVLVGVTALAIDIGYISTTKNELQNVSDAAALAATSELGQIYFDNNVYDHDTNYTAIRDVAVAVGLNNLTSGLKISLDNTDIEVGEWNGTFDPSNTTKPNAVKVTARSEQLNGKLYSLFAGIFGIDSFDVKADAVAALSGQAEFDPGEIKLPLALSQAQFPDACTEPIHLNSNTDCAAWHIFGGKKDDSGLSLNGSDMGDVLLGIILDHEEGEAWLAENYPDIQEKKIPDVFSSPSVIAGTTEFLLTEGGVTSMFTGDATNPVPMQALFDFYKEHDDDENYFFPDEAPYNELSFDRNDVWVTSIPVYAEPSGSCTSTSKSETRVIVGAADIIVKAVNGPSDGKNIEVDITCSYKKVRGGGGMGGNVGIIPNLVE